MSKIKNMNEYNFKDLVNEQNRELKVVLKTSSWEVDVSYNTLGVLIDSFGCDYFYVEVMPAMSQLKDIIGWDYGRFPPTQEEINKLLEYVNRLRRLKNDNNKS